MSHTASLKILSLPGVPGCKAPAAGVHLEEGHGEAPGLHQVHLIKVCQFYQLAYDSIYTISILGCL